MRIRSIVFCVALLVLMISIGMSQYSAKETFNYAKGASIDTLLGGAGDGWAGPWYKILANQKNALVVADTGLPYDALNYDVPHVGRHLESVPDTTGNEQRYARNLDKTWPNDSGKVYWISLLMDVKNATDNSTWLGLKLFSGDNGEAGMLGKGHGLDKYTCGSGWHGGPGNEVSTTTWSEGPQWLVGKIAMRGTATGASNDTIYMWISPDPTAGEPQVASIACYSYFKFSSGFDRIRLEYGGSIGTGLRVSFDEIRLATSWAEVSSSLGQTVTGVPYASKGGPNRFSLSQNYPNPFNPSTQILYSLKNSSKVRLTVFDLLGRQVAVLVDGVQSAGEHIVPFSGTGFASGIYFYRLENNNNVITKKMMLLK